MKKNDKLNILFLRSNPVNPDSRVEKEAVALANKGYSVTIFAWDRESNYKVRKDSLKREGIMIPIYRVGIRAQYGSGKQNIMNIVKFQKEIIKFVHKNKDNIDFIHSCDLDTGLTGLYLAKRLNKKTVYDIFDFYSDSRNFSKIIRIIVKKIEIFVINQSDATIICSNKRKEQIKDSKPKKLQVIHNTPNVKIKENLYNIKKENKTRICYVGVLGGGRMIKELIEITIKNKQFELHIGGFGPYENEIKSLAKEHGNIFFYGRLPYEKTLELERTCDIVPALYDPNIMNHKYAAPNKFYEALAIGKPLIMIRDTGMSEIVEQENIGIVIEYNKFSLEKAINDISYMTNEELMKMHKRMQSIYASNFDWQTMKERLYILYRDLGGLK